jgi:phenylalanyl-tRNA synthetase beta chain
VRGVNTTVATPAWMVERLARCGQRSVTPLVDISNYVMFEYGQPTHIFDLDKIHGGLTVRWGRAGEQLKLLNGTTITVDDKVGVIADDREVESLAGIMGGDATSVSDDTRNIYVEAAFWWPEAVQGRSRRFNFSTDAGHRFERGVDPSRTVQIIERITQLIAEICGGQAGAMDDQTLHVPQAAPVTLRVARASRVIGMPLTQAQCADALKRLGFAIAEGEGTLTVTPPPHRFDLLIEEDLIEEVARLIGFNNLPTTAPLAPITARVRPEAQRSRFAVRRSVAALGYQETINFSFVEAHWEQDLAGNANPVKLLNPIASQMSVMRSSLLGSLLQVLKFNLDRKAPRVRVFELGRVFMRDDSVATTDSTVRGVDQPMRVAGLAWGDADEARWDGKPQRIDFYDVKGDVEALLSPLVPTFEVAEHPALHPGRSARVMVGGKAIGFVGELHPRWRQKWDFAQAPVLFELDLDAVMARPVPVAQPVPKHQAVERDIAVVVAEAVTHDALMQAIREATAAQGLLRDATLFDIYRPQPLRDGAVTATGGVGAGREEHGGAPELPERQRHPDRRAGRARRARDRRTIGRQARRPLEGMMRMNAAEFTLEALETPALTKAHLADLLFEQIGLNKRESKDMVEAFFELVAGSLIEGTDVKISGFGNFQIRVKAPRPGRNPRTGEAIPIGERRVATFHASAKLKEQIQGSAEQGSATEVEWSLGAE